jgi:hypothetical protein
VLKIQFTSVITSILMKTINKESFIIEDNNN